MRATVIVATMNRSEQLERLTLKSLLQQDSDAFDVVIWDASDTDDTAKVCSNYPKKDCYFKAPRRGLAKQRNDAIQYVRKALPANDIIVFLDDDVILSKDAVSGLIKTYETHDTHDAVMGVGIPIIGESRKHNALKDAFKALFLNLNFSKRHMTHYAYGFQVDSEKNSTEVNWLSGCSMSYRTSCFDKFCFDERLCKYGGYSLAEDAVFSSTLYREGMRLRLSDYGTLIHVRDGNNRLDYRKMVASFLYNKNILFHAINDGSSVVIRALWRIPFIWNQSYNLVSLLIRAIRDGKTHYYITGIMDVINSEKRAQNEVQIIKDDTAFKKK